MIDSADGEPQVATATRCLDCGAQLAGAYCHQFGQRRESRLVSLRTLLRRAQ